MSLRGLLGRLGAWALRLNPVVAAVGMLVMGAAGFSAMVTYNQMNDFCLKCHKVRGPYHPIDLDSIAHEPYAKRLGTEAHINCVDCHTDKELLTFMEGVALLVGRGFEAATTLPRAAAPGSSAQYDDAECLRCHYRILETDKLEGERLFELTPKLAQIGLRFSHRRHYWMRAWTPELDRRLREIEAGEITVEQDELDSLRHARLGHCAQCHDRWYRDPEAVDKTVNLYTSNPMTCASCHLDASPDEHPGRVLGLPAELTCRRCHTGTLHGRFAMFEADKDSRDKEPCVKCHPAYVREDQAAQAEDSK